MPEIDEDAERLAVAGAMLLWPGVSLSVAHPWAVVWFGLMGSIFLALLGFFSSIWAEKFDHNAAITNFVIAPLSLLSGTFYVIDNLAPVFQTISRLNPFFYVISGFRFGFLGITDVPLITTVAVLVVFIIAFYLLCWSLIQRGRGLRS